MEIKPIKFKARCDMGVCKKKADFAIRLKRLGAANEIHICQNCLEILSKAAQMILEGKNCKMVKIGEKSLGNGAQTIKDNEEDTQSCQAIKVKKTPKANGENKTQAKV